MKHSTLFKYLSVAMLLMMSSCARDKGSVSISGTVSEGKGEKIALMHLSGNNPVLVDTLTLGEDGKFSFRPKVEQGGPDFFCLVMGGQTIPVVSDTLQTPVVISTQKDRFTSYQVEDSLNNVLRQAVGLGNDLRRSLLNLSVERQKGNIGPDAYADSVNNMIVNYKASILDRYIYQDPASPVSYYLLFETVSGLQVFNPLDAKDNRAYGAVANLWLMNYPNSSRTKFLEQRTREGMAVRLKARQDQLRTDSLIQNAIVDKATFLDLNLIGTNDEMVSLSSINGKGNITLLDFTAYYVTEASVPHNQKLMNVYNKYKDQGLRIYQVCVDPDVNFWKVSAANLPWTVVRDQDLLFDQNAVLQYSGAAAVYNVTQLPTVFVLGRDGGAVARVTDDEKLEAAVAKAM